MPNDLKISKKTGNIREILDSGKVIELSGSFAQYVGKIIILTLSFAIWSLLKLNTI